MREKHALASDAIHVEQELLQEAVGVQDQTIAAYGGFNRMDFRTDGAIEVKPVLTAPGRLEELEQHLALYFTGFSRTASEVAKEQIRMTPRRERELQLTYQLVNEAQAILTSPHCSLDEFGRLLHETWQTQAISNPNIDDIYEVGRRAGALGGKLLGAGGGGFMLFFVRPERRSELRRNLKHLLCVPFAFSNRGAHILMYEPEELYDKALARERRDVYAQHA
jgi:D-glycero-alpha-D-manno-heptose-7-phosphate kinase